MTLQSKVLGDSKYIPIFDDGFVGLVDHMGDDSSVVQAARVSYGDGTKTVSEDSGLINYLMRNMHTSPFEMIQLKFHAKMPIFVARQWVRHRTASINEYSGRYSVMVNEFYIPNIEVIQPQAKDNKQGRGGEMSMEDRLAAQHAIQYANTRCYETYKALLGEEGKDVYATEFTSDFEGISREMARGVLSVNNYTEWYWTANLHNLFHFLALRMDSHAQYEIRKFADAMYELIQPICPLSCKAFEDYRLYGERLSRLELEAIKHSLTLYPTHKISLLESAAKAGLKGRELQEFKDKFDLE